MAISTSLISIALLFLGYLFTASKDKNKQEMDTVSKTTSVSTTKDDEKE